MDAKTLVALRGSIRKWQAIVNKTGEDQGPYNCPLCLLFNSPEHPSRRSTMCRGCPVFDYSGDIGCHNTPYETWDECDQDDSEGLAKAAQAELDFLISLLPEGELP